MTQTTFVVQILTIVLTAGLATLGSWFVGRSSVKLARETAGDERNRHARYLAIRVVCVLDEFAFACGEVVGDDGMSDAEGYRRTRVEIPDFAYPSDVDWKALDSDLMYGLLSFPNEIGRAERDIQWTWENDAFPPDFDEAFDVRMRRYAEIGLRAIDLMEAIQRRYEIVPRSETGWSNRSYIEDSVRRSNEKQVQIQPSAMPTPN